MSIKRLIKRFKFWKLRGWNTHSNMVSSLIHKNSGIIRGDKCCAIKTFAIVSRFHHIHCIMCVCVFVPLLPEPTRMNKSYCVAVTTKYVC